MLAHVADLEHRQRRMRGVNQGGCVTGRRDYVVGLLGLFAAPWIGRAQPSGRSFRVGILAGAGVENPAADAGIWDGFFADMRSFGYVEGRNLTFERRYYDDGTEQLAAFAADLARLTLDVIVTRSVPAPEAMAAGRLPGTSGPRAGSMRCSHPGFRG